MEFPIGLPSKIVLLKRINAYLAASPKFFFAAFTWEAFGLIANLSMHITDQQNGYYFMTGTGASLGVLLTSVILILISGVRPGQPEFYQQLETSTFVSLSAGVTAGTLWQYSVNISQWNHFTFTGAFFFVYFMSSLAYWLSCVLIRLANSYLPSYKRCKAILPVNAYTMWSDFTLALAVGAADAFFVGTEDEDYTDGWLGGFRCYTDTPVFTAMCLAGASGFCGYLIVQAIQIMTIKDGYCWLDEKQAPLAAGDEDSTSDTAVLRGGAARPVDMELSRV